MFLKLISNRRVLLPIFLITLFSAIWMLMGVDAEAASFGHVHTAYCYASDSIYCTQHVRTETYRTEVYHCTNCLEQTLHNETVYSDTCRGGYMKPEIIGWKQVCSVCGNVRKDDNPSESPHWHTVTKLVCGKTESSSAADVSLNISTPGFSNTSVILDAGVMVNDGNFQLAAEPYDFGQGYTSNSTYEVTENGTYTVSIKDASGRVVSTSVTVNSIDKEQPVIVGISKDTEDWSESGVTITVDASDGASGLAEAAYSFNGADFTSSNTFHVNSNGTVTVRVKDAAGNITEDSITISNCGRDPAVVAREREEERQREEALRLQKEAEEKAALEKAEAERIAAEKAVAEKAAAEKAKKEKNDSKKKNDKSSDKKLSEISSNEKTADEVSANDVSKNDKTKNDVSKNSLINVKNMSGNGPKPDLIKPEPKEEVTAEELMAEAQENGYTEASVGPLTLKLGIGLAALGLIFFTFFNYIYMEEDGRKRLVVLCKIEKTDKRIIVKVKKGKISEHGRYLIYFSPWNRIGLNSKDVYVEIEGNQDLIATNEREAFTY